MTTITAQFAAEMKLQHHIIITQECKQTTQSHNEADISERSPSMFLSMVCDLFTSQNTTHATGWRLHRLQHSQSEITTISQTCCWNNAAANDVLQH